ncbi:MAG: hypothetical protein LBV26_03605 [Bacteroidales bacterium]|nr:hypothetical protein [Bacteroidales bacterium]
MTEITNVIKQHKELCVLASEKKIKQSLDILLSIISNVLSGDLRNEYDTIVMTYKNMLEYTVNGINDPQRNNVYLRLIQSILKLSDRAVQDILLRYSGWHTYSVKRQVERELMLTGKTIAETVDDLIFKPELDEWLTASTEMPPDPESEMSKKHRQLITNIFNHMWLTDYYGEAEYSLISIITNPRKFRWHEANLFISAITLSALRTWQTGKLMKLLDIYEEKQEQVMERALCGLILNLHYYDNRIMLYPEIGRRLEMLGDTASFREHCRIIVLQIIRSRETEPLARRLHEEILPHVEKLRPKIEDKLELDGILPREADGKNPDWSEVFSDSDEIYKAMEDLTNLQIEGADVYMSAFSQMKNFDFFKDFKNWFMPFYPDHEAVNEIHGDEILGPAANELVQALYKTPFICNSDKFSLLLNLNRLPSSQKNMMAKIFSMELEGMHQLNNESLTDPYRNFRINITQYLQDIYRFFKLSPYKKEFEDIFTGRLDIYNSLFFALTGNGDETEAGLADYFFNKSFYSDALTLFIKQIAKKPDDAGLYEKTGYCFQEKANYRKALQYYMKAELIDRKPWTLKKIGLCLRRLGETEKALEYYIHASDREPENIHTTIMIAHCYLDLKDYGQALKYYFRVEYTDPANLKILRPIAYCYFALGRFGDSEKYYDRLSAGKLSAHDLINKGHLALCQGQMKEAAECYRQSIVSGELSIAQFTTIFSEDKELLCKLGVKHNDLSIMHDYVLFSIT